ncbi:MAG: hypothetical protein EAZ81_03520 [Verrucomicrobia bacterium]|nr:MAG: hypothetical protein EAZ81_03520 [Verrucomicrobiota bacterium]
MPNDLATPTSELFQKSDIYSKGRHHATAQIFASRKHSYFCKFKIAARQGLLELGITQKNRLERLKRFLSVGHVVTVRDRFLSQLGTKHENFSPKSNTDFAKGDFSLFR